VAETVQIPLENLKAIATSIYRVVEKLDQLNCENKNRFGGFVVLEKGYVDFLNDWDSIREKRVKSLTQLGANVQMVVSWFEEFDLALAEACNPKQSQ
jgi:hypothetical protein